MDLIPLVLYWTTVFILINGYQPFVSGQQFVSSHPKVSISVPRFSATRKFQNTFSYKSNNHLNAGQVNDQANNDKNGTNAWILSPTFDSVGQTFYGHQKNEVKQTAIQQQGMADVIVQTTTPFSNGINVKSDIIEPSSHVHQNLVASIEKLIFDILGVEAEQATTAPSKTITSMDNDKHIFTKKLNKISVAKNSESVSVKTKVQTATIPITSVNILRPKSTKHASKPKGNKLQKLKSTKTVTTTLEPAESIATTPEPLESIATTPEPLEPIATTSKPSKSIATTPEPEESVVTTPESLHPIETTLSRPNQHCFCLMWCPLGTVFRGHCGQHMTYGVQRLICCLQSVFSDDADYD